MKKALFLSLSAAIVVLFATLTIVYCAVPNEITYNGRLREYGQPITATRTMNFKIFDDVNAGASPWGSGNISVTVSSGVFSHILSPQNIDWKKKDYWLETTVEGKVLSPREKLTSHIYALHAQEAENINSDSKVSFSINNTEYMSIETNGEAKNITNGTTYYMVPRGAIIMWSGTTIPNGWAICDGSNGTPNLEDRFILATNNLNELTKTGGSNSYLLSVAQLPAHNHTITVDSAGNHSHTGTTGNQSQDHTHTTNGVSTNPNTGSYRGITDDNYSFDGNRALTYSITTTGENSSHTHSFTTDSSGSHTHNATSATTGSGTQIDNRPAFYKLAFIMKL
ncbi:MAG: tail fiber protein [Endomicrobiales bacterium]|nr:tail fiber protein [Endomicrobiales bacterium]